MKTLPCLSPENHPCREKRGGAKGGQRDRERGEKERKTNHVNRKGYAIFMVSSEMFKVRKALEGRSRGEGKDKEVREEWHMTCKN